MTLREHFAGINHHEEKLGNNLRSTANVRYTCTVPTRHKQNGCFLFSKKVVFEQHHSFLFRGILVSISNSLRNFFNRIGISRSPKNFSLFKNFSSLCSSRFCETGCTIMHEQWSFLYKFHSAKGSKWKISTLEKEKIAFFV